jgi:hypothetical protein
MKRQGLYLTGFTLEAKKRHPHYFPPSWGSVSLGGYKRCCPGKTSLQHHHRTDVSTHTLFIIYSWQHISSPNTSCKDELYTGRQETKIALTTHSKDQFHYSFSMECFFYPAHPFTRGELTCLCSWRRAAPPPATFHGAPLADPEWRCAPAPTRKCTSSWCCKAARSPPRRILYRSEQLLVLTELNNNILLQYFLTGNIILMIMGWFY